MNLSPPDIKNESGSARRQASALCPRYDPIRSSGAVHEVTANTQHVRGISLLWPPASHHPLLVSCRPPKPNARRTATRTAAAGRCSKAPNDAAECKSKVSQSLQQVAQKRRLFRPCLGRPQETDSRRPARDQPTYPSAKKPLRIHVTPPDISHSSRCTVRPVVGGHGAARGPPCKAAPSFRPRGPCQVHTKTRNILMQRPPTCGRGCLACCGLPPRVESQVARASQPASKGVAVHAV